MKRDVLQLNDDHRRMLEVDSGIPADIIKQRGYRSMATRDDLVELTKLGFSKGQQLPGLLIPIHGVDGRVVSYQLRPDKPRTLKDKPLKYESLPKLPPRLDVPPGIRDRIGDPSVPLWITEGSKKADSAVARGLVCISLSGVWNWRGKNDEGGSVALGDFESIALTGRTIYLAFDSDVTEKPSVRLALDRFTGFLKSRGASIQVVRIPALPGGKAGLDDYFVSGGAAEGLIASSGDLSTLPTNGASSGKPIADNLVDLALNEGVELWHNAQGEPYATFPVDGHLVHARVTREGKFTSFLRRIARRGGSRLPHREALAQATDCLAGIASDEGSEHPTSKRVWSDGNACYLFLADADGQVVRIAPDGWGTVNAKDCPARFVPPAHAQPLPVPRRDGSLDQLRDLLSVDDAGFTLLTSFLVGCFLPVGTMPILVATAEAGCGKTKGCGFIRRVIDPSVALLRNPSFDSRDLASAVNNGFVLAFDNVSTLKPAIADDLCRIASGQGFALRELHTTADERIVRARNPIILNGIGDFITRGDLADRSVRVEFQRIEGTSSRKTERELDDAFDRVHASALGALLDRVVMALASYRSTLVDDLPRLADFATWVCASESPEQHGKFVKAYRASLNEHSATLIEGDSLALAIVALVDSAGDIDASAQDILQQLNDVNGGGRNPVGWPTNPRALAGHLQRIAPQLRKVGIEVEHGERTSRKRPWRIYRRDTTAGPSSSSQPSQRVDVEPDDPFFHDDASNDGVPEGSLFPSLPDAGKLNLYKGFDDANDGHDGRGTTTVTGRVVQ